MEDDTITISRFGRIAHFIAAILLGILLLLPVGEYGRRFPSQQTTEPDRSAGQRFPRQCFYTTRPSSGDYHAIIDDKSDSLSKLIRVVTAKQITPTALKKNIKLNMDSGRWSAFRLERFVRLPLPSLSVRLRQLRR